MNKADVDDAAAAVRAKTLLAENAVLLAEANSAQLKQEQKKLLRVRADDVVKKNVIRAMTLGLIPFPALDIVALTHAQFKMTDDLLGLYHLNNI